MKEKNFEIICVGNVGNGGIKYLIENKRDALVKNFSPLYLDYALKNIYDDEKKNENILSFLESLYNEKGNFDITNICTYIDKRDPKNKHNPDYKSIDKKLKYAIFKVGEGGILSALYIALSALSIGVEYSLKDIPIRQETVDISQYFDIDPYRLYTKNCFIIFVKDENMFYKDLGEVLFGDRRYFYYHNKKNFFIKKFAKTYNNNKKIRIDIESMSCLTKNYKDELDKVINVWKNNENKL